MFSSGTESIVFSFPLFSVFRYFTRKKRWYRTEYCNPLRKIPYFFQRVAKLCLKHSGTTKFTTGLSFHGVPIAGRSVQPRQRNRVGRRSKIGESKGIGNSTLKRVSRCVRNLPGSCPRAEREKEASRISLDRSRECHVQLS